MSPCSAFRCWSETNSRDDASPTDYHPDRVFWPAADGYAAITKRELLEYYARVSPYLLKHLRDRPLTLSRYPTGLHGKHFFQKHVETPLPEFVDRVSLYAEQHDRAGDYVLCNNVETLLWLGQTANLELHPWYSRISSESDAEGRPLTFSGSVEELEASVLNYPDFMVFDLDPYVYSGNERPGEDPLLHEAGFERVREAALWLRDVLDSLGLRSFVKTSGKSGLHIFVPILRQFDYDTVRSMSQQICRFVLQRHPDALTMEWSVPHRAGKVFLDHNQNTRGKTLASAYSPRALPGAPVSMPFRWDEIGSVYPTDFTLHTAAARIEEVGDLWQDILAAKNDFSNLVATQLG